MNDKSNKQRCEQIYCECHYKKERAEKGLLVPVKRIEYLRKFLVTVGSLEARLFIGEQNLD